MPSTWRTRPWPSGSWVQPDVLDKAARIPGAASRGLLGRFLFAAPESTLGRRAVDSPPMPALLESLWDQTVARILAIPEVDAERQVIGLDDGAHALLRELRAKLEPHLEPVVGRYVHITDRAGKLAGRVLRLAAVFHLAEGRQPSQPIDATTMTYAIAFSLCALRQADHVNAAWRLSESRDSSPGVPWVLPVDRTDPPV
ncbi:DUF3987 domain-containing protein [Microbispora sp. H13382]|uniref:DUF3987 domain-containing protein n=1 Tax=Microbispora sp. H13382 TaxID=2729112 RepID=UPI001600AA16|nr:DUF3987 domain-containing protein [Microbispora sp. H13382]